MSDTWVTLIELDPSATIRPDRPYEPAGALVDRLAAPDGREGLTFGETLGTGGMGIVRAAEQRRLGRQVAVKSLRPGRNGPDETRRLLAEAWVTGSLEHPNIVPVHDIAVDASRQPHIVMKRISGVPWASRMDDADRLEMESGSRDLLGWNLRILSTVANALHFAHSRGVLHRDVKPENVMIGPFGEVYLLDWGVACAVSPGDPNLPASDGRVAGTPRYIAPELAHGRPSGIPTDVYLLGAVLFRVLAGRPPHGGLTIPEILAGVDRFTPTLPADTPDELAALVRDAMRADPAERVPDAEQFRQRVETFLAHRSSTELAARADDDRVRLEAAIATGASPVEVHGVLGACRFGFRQALRDWPNNPQALDGLERALGAAVDFDLATRNPAGAAVLLAEMRAPSDALRARVDRALAARDAEARALQRYSDDNDPSIGQRTRVFVVASLGLVWIASPLFYGWRWGVAVDLRIQATGYLLQGLLVYGLALWGRESLTATTLNRNLVALVLCLPPAQLVLIAVFALEGSPAHRINAHVALLYTVFCGVGALIVHRALAIAAVAFGLTTLLVAWEPTWAPVAKAAGSAILTAVLLGVWYPSMPAAPRHRTP